MIIYFDGPDQVKKSTLIKTVSEVIGVPMWARAAFLPHHGKCKNNGMHNPDSIWYVLDELKTVDLLKKMGGNVVIDRHPLVSELVYRRVEGKVSMLEFSEHNPSEEMVILLHDGDKDKPIVKIYQTVLKEKDIDYMTCDTSDGEEALFAITVFLHQVLPTVSGLDYLLK
jgi:hypothetical protein